MCWHCLPFMHCPLVANTNARWSIHKGKYNTMAYREYRAPMYSLLTIAGSSQNIGKVWTYFAKNLKLESWISWHVLIKISLLPTWWACRWEDSCFLQSCDRSEWPTASNLLSRSVIRYDFASHRNEKSLSRNEWWCSFWTL